MIRKQVGSLFVCFERAGGRLDQKVPKLCFGMGLVKEIIAKVIERN